MPTGVYLRTEYHKKINSNSHKGLKLSQEHCRNISLALVGKKLSKTTPFTEERKLKMSLIAKAKGFGKWMIGKKLSEETKNKLSLIGKGKKYPGRINSKTFKKNHKHSIETKYKLSKSGRKYIFESDNIPIKSLWTKYDKEKYYKLYNQRSFSPIVSRHKRRSIMNGLFPITIELIQKIYEDNIKRYGTLTCYLCFKKIEIGQDSLEHKIPISRGGNNLYENLDISHRLCNYKKHTKTEQEYRDLLCQK